MNLRKFAEGKDCQVRLPGCLYGPETVVLAHIRKGGTAGVGQKPPDLCGVHACAKCHDLIDGRSSVANLTKYDVERALLYGLLRTLALVSKEIA
jgi:hypothetical protein